MTYNYHGNWNEFTGHHSAVFPRSDEVDAGERQWNQVELVWRTVFRFFVSLSVFSEWIYAFVNRELQATNVDGFWSFWQPEMNYVIAGIVNVG